MENLWIIKGIDLEYVNKEEGGSSALDKDIKAQVYVLIVNDVLNSQSCASSFLFLFSFQF